MTRQAVPNSYIFVHSYSFKEEALNHRRWLAHGRQTESHHRGVDPGVLGVLTPKMYSRGQSVFLTPQMSHSLIQNCCWITLQVSHHKWWKTCQKRKVKLIFRGAYRLSGPGIVECLEIIDVGCNLKQFDCLTWQTPTPDFTTDLRHYVIILYTVFPISCRDVASSDMTNRPASATGNSRRVAGDDWVVNWRLNTIDIVNWHFKTVVG